MTITLLRCWIFISILSIITPVKGEDFPLNYSKKISSDSLKEFVYILASDSLEGRETGRPGQKRAANFLASKYMLWNLNPAGTNFILDHKGTPNEIQFFQNHSISVRNNKTRNFSAGGETHLFGKDFYYSNINGDTSLDLKSFIFIGVKNSTISDTRNKKIFLNKNLILFDANSDSTNFQLNKFELNASPQQTPFLVLIITVSSFRSLPDINARIF